MDEGRGDGRNRELSRSIMTGGLDARLEQVVAVEPGRAFLLVVRGDRPGRVYRLEKSRSVIGRDDGAEVRVSDLSVSGAHARVIDTAGGFEIEDLGSRNGTFVDGRRVERAALRAGSRVRVGLVEFAFLVDRSSRSYATVPLEDGVSLVTPGVPLLARRRPGPEDEEGPSVQSLVRLGLRGHELAHRHRRSILPALAGGVALGLSTLLALPPATKARCEVGLHPEARADLATAGAPPTPQQLFLGPERAFVSEPLVARTLKAVGADPDDASSAAGRLQLESVGPSRFVASFSARALGQPRPEPAAFLEAHVKTYVQSEVDKALHGARMELDFLRAQLTAAEKELASVDAELVAFRTSNADRLLDQGGLAGTSRAQLEARRLELSAEIQRFGAELAAARRQITAAAPPPLSRLRDTEAERDRLAGLDRALAATRARGARDADPEVKRLLAERQSVEAQLRQRLAAASGASEPSTSPQHQANQARADAARAQLVGAQREAAEIDKTLGRLRDSNVVLPEIEARLGELTRAHEASRQLHGQLFEKLKKAELRLSLERASVGARYELLEPARAERPRWSKTIAQRLALGLFLGLLGFAGFVAVQEGRRHVRRALREERGLVPS